MRGHPCSDDGRRAEEAGVEPAVGLTVAVEEAEADEVEAVAAESRRSR